MVFSFDWAMERDRYVAALKTSEDSTVGFTKLNDDWAPLLTYNPRQFTLRLFTVPHVPLSRYLFHLTFLLDS